MKKEIFILLTASLVVSSCVDNEDIYKNPDNSKKDQVLTLSKYPQKVIDIETGSKEHLALLNATTRSTFLIKDSVWPDKKGHSLIYETNEHGTTANTMRYIYLGSLLKGGSLEEQRFQRLTNELDPLYISYSFPAKIVGDIIEKPSLQSQRTSLSKIMNQEGMTRKQIVSFIYDMNQFTYYNELKLAFNCNIDVASVFNISTSVAQGKIRKKCGLVAKFIQKNFTVDLDLPADGCLLKNNNELSNVGPYDPVYISSITYERMGVMMFDSSYAYDSLRVAVKAAFDAKIINGKLELTSEQTKIISEADLKIAIISGDGSYSVKTVDGINGFKEFIIAGGEFSKDVPGDPIFYSASYLSDDSPFYAKFRVNIPYK